MRRDIYNTPLYSNLEPLEEVLDKNYGEGMKQRMEGKEKEGMKEKEGIMEEREGLMKGMETMEEQREGILEKKEGMENKDKKKKKKKAVKPQLDKLKTSVKHNSEAWNNAVVTRNKLKDRVEKMQPHIDLLYNISDDTEVARESSLKMQMQEDQKSMIEGSSNIVILSGIAITTVSIFIIVSML